MRLLSRAASRGAAVHRAALRAVGPLPLLASLLAAGCVGIETSGPYVRPSPATVSPFAGHSGQRAQVRYPVDTAPAVLVLDSVGLPAAGVLVTFAPRTGSGTVTNGAVRTDGNGIARVGDWTVGPDVGEDTLLASVAGLPAAAFVARAFDPCRTEGRVVAIGDSLSGFVTDSTCRTGQRVAADHWGYTTVEAEPVELTVRSSRYQPFLDVRDQALLPIAQGDSVAGGVSRLTLVARPGTWVVRAGTERRGATGAYSLTARRQTAGLTGCSRTNFVTRGVVFTSTIGQDDCRLTVTGQSGTYYGEALSVVVAAGSRISVRVSSAELPPALQLHDGNDALRGESYGTPGATVSVAYDSPATQVFTILVFSTQPQRTGSYRVDVAP